VRTVFIITTGCFHFQCGRSSSIGTMLMQFTGHGATQGAQLD